MNIVQKKLREDKCNLVQLITAKMDELEAHRMLIVPLFHDL